jgi:hypothetical protein
VLPSTPFVFRDEGEESSVKIGIVFEKPWHTAVLDIAKLAECDIEFGSNSWRGDQYEPHLRQIIAPASDHIGDLPFNQQRSIPFSPLIRFPSLVSPGQSSLLVSQPTPHGLVDGHVKADAGLGKQKIGSP